MASTRHHGLEVDDSTVQASDVAWVDGLRPTDFVAGSDARVAQLATLTKRLFDVAATLQDKQDKPLGPLASLLIEDFDEEQVWQQRYHQ